MGLVSIKCPNCGANIEFDGSKDFGICAYCGTKVMQEKIVVEHRIDESEKYNNYINLANRAYMSKNYKEANEYYTKAMEIDQSDCMVAFRKALSAWFVSTDRYRSNEVAGGVKAAYSSADKENKTVISSEIESFVFELDIKSPAEFIGPDSCENHVVQIAGTAGLLRGLYELIEEEHREIFCSKAIGICNLLKRNYNYTKVYDSKKSNLNLHLSLSGVSISSNSSNDETLVYNTPQSVIDDVNAIKQFFTDEINREINLKLKDNKNQISEAIAEIRKLPVQLIILHAVFSLPMLIIGIFVLLFVHPVAGITIISIEIISFIVYRKIDSGKTAQKAYGNLMQSIVDYFKNKKQIKN